MIHVIYRASQQLQKQLALQEQGAREVQVVELLATAELMAFATVTPEGVAQINLADTNQSWQSGHYVISSRPEYRFTPCLEKVSQHIMSDPDGWFDGNVQKRKAVIVERKSYHIFDSVPTVESLLSVLTAAAEDLSAELSAKQAELEADFEVRNDKYLAEKEKREAERHAEDARREKEDAERRAKAEETHIERIEWIGKHGSERLKLMLENGYELKKTYEEERAALELPGFEYVGNSFGDDFEYSDRANPSLDALKMLKQFGEYSPKIILVKSEYDAEGDFDAYEAILIQPSWCRTPLLKTVL